MFTKTLLSLSKSLGAAMTIIYQMVKVTLLRQSECGFVFVFVFVFVFLFLFVFVCNTFAITWAMLTMMSD